MVDLVICIYLALTDYDSFCNIMYWTLNERGTNSVCCVFVCMCACARARVRAQACYKGRGYNNGCRIVENFNLEPAHRRRRRSLVKFLGNVVECM